MRRILAPFMLALTGLILTACGGSTNTDQTVENTDDLPRATAEEMEAIVEQFIMAEDGEVIEIPAGYYEFTTQLILDGVDDVTVRGAGMEKTILSFEGLAAGGEGVRAVDCENVVFEDFTAQDSPGDCIKTQHCDGVTFRRLNTTWTGGEKSENGIYAIYPVQCNRVLVEECVASHSRDAGIYVGQSTNIIVRNNHAFGNVAGIEIENSDNAEVYGNLAENNTGGILVFNLPGLPKRFGRNTRIYDNDILNNNHVNFADAISESNNGNAVTQIPPGSGVVLLACDEVEVSNNRIHGNKTVGIAVASYYITGFPVEEDSLWSPYVSDISIHDNSFERPMAPADLSKDLGKLISAKNAHGVGKTQDIIWDGIVDEARGTDPAANPMNICIDEEEAAELNFTRFDLVTYGETGKDSDIGAFGDIEPFLCSYTVETDVSSVADLAR